MLSQPIFSNSSVRTVLAGERPLFDVSLYVIGHHQYARRLRSITSYLKGVF
mgnify:CR=1 FL=1